jgi:SAM-dependent methyltransferase
MEKSKEWFETWFDSEYCRKLYAHRNDSEAELFISKLQARFQFAQNSRALDLACGSGRHSRVLHRLGFNVTGLDLSKESIELAKAESPGGIRFVRADMRHFELSESYDLILNLFTSFGYFRKEEDNLNVLKKCLKHLNSGGFLIIDYLNDHLTRMNLKENDFLSVDGVQFEINRRIEGSLVIKDISVTRDTDCVHFNEVVQLLSLQDFKLLASKTGFEVIHTFGSYELDSFEPLFSERLILILQPAACSSHV